MTRLLPLAGVCLLFMGVECGAPPPGPQNPAACPPPTIAQCQTPVTACDNHFFYLGKIDKDSPCSLLLSQAAVSAAGLYAEKTVLTPKTYSGLQSFPSDGGTTKVHGVPEDSALDLRGMQSFTFGQRMATAFDLRRNDPVLQLAARQKLEAQVDAYNANGNGVASCEEYAFEKFFDIAAWDAQVLISNATDDHRRAFELAYGPSTVRTSIGTRHLFDPVLKARDGSPSGISVPFEVQRPKNDYFRVPHGSGMGTKVIINSGADNSVTEGPLGLMVTVKDLSRSLSLHGVIFQDAALTGILDDPRRIVQEDFAWHRQMSLTMQNAGVLDEALDLEQERRDAFLKLIAGRDEVVRQIAEYASGGNPPPVAGGSRFAERWWDSPFWNPNPASAVANIEALTIQQTTVPNFNQLNNSQQTFITYSNQVSPAKESPSSLASFNGPKVVQPCKGSTNPFFCLIARLESIDQALEDALHAAQDRGCLDLTGPTACDWTPRDFTERMRGFADTAREEAYRKCDESVDSFLDLKTRALKQDYADGGIGVNYAAHDYTTSTSELDLYFFRQDQYLDVVGEVVGPLLERKPVNGTNKLRLARSDGESKTLGDKWFGASMHYGVGFSMEGLPDPQVPDSPDAGDCVIQTRANAEFGLDAKVLTVTIPLVSAFMRASDDHFAAKVQVLDQQWDEDTPLTNGTVPVFTDGQMAYQTFLEGHDTFAIGYVVISIGASVGGGVGYQVNVQAGRKTIISGGCQVSEIGVYPSVIPLTFVEGQAYAALEAIVARAGIKGHLTIASISVPISGEVSIGPTDSDPTILDAHFELGAKLRMRFFGGRISVFVELGVCPLCADFEADLIKWNGIQRDIKLFEYGLSVRLGDLKRVAKQQGVLLPGMP